MRHTTTATLSAAIVGLLFAPWAAAQTLEQICPGAMAGTGALWGEVADSDAEMVLPGVRVVASWDYDGDEQRYEVQTGQDGLYVMCLPLETELAVRASGATATASPLAITLTETITRHDLSLSMTVGDTGERLWLCVDDGQSVINIQFARLVRCDEDWQPLERCPKTELGRITVHPVGAGSGMLREMIEQLVQEAKRIGANAVVYVQSGGGGLSFGGAQHLTSLTAEGVRIEVDPSTCT